MKKILFFMILFFVCGYVKAENIILVREKIDNAYVYYYDSSAGRDKFLFAEKYYFGNNIAYCLELGRKINSNIYTMTDSFDSINMSKEDIDYIKLISYFGYDYPGHHSDNYYMAAQELIWNRISGINIKWVRNLNSSDVIDVSMEKQEIIELINKFNVKPSFDGREFELFRGRGLHLTDSNYVLHDYEVIDGKATIYDDVLYISDGDDINKVVLRRKNYSNKSFFIYNSDISQKMMSSGKVDLPTSTVTIKFKSGSLTIEKLDSETKSDKTLGEATLNGAIYEVFNKNNDELVDYFEIGKKNTITNLALGKYYIKEKRPSTGYLLDENIYEVEVIQDNLNLNLTVYEDVIKRKVDLFKVFASDNTGILTSESGITFEIYDRDNKLIDSITTDEDGYATVTLPYGSYTFKQINTTEGYYKVDDFKVTIDKYDERPIYKLLSDSEIKTKVKIIKKDLDTDNNIIDSNIKFKIYDVKNKEFVKFKVTYPEVKEIEVFEVDDNGIFITPEALGYGEYIIYEVDEEMNGYLYNKDGIHFTIDKDANLINDDEFDMILEVPFYNKRVKGKIIINKYGESFEYDKNIYYYKDIMLENVSFELYAKDDIYENGVLRYSKDSIVDSSITDNKGRIVIDNLPLGDYYLKEIESSNNNYASNEIYNITLKYKDQYTDKVNYEIDIYNHIRKGKVVITKLDSDTKEVIANTLIEIWDINNNTIYKGYTDNQGKLVIDDLPYGEYFISEIEASTGYQLLEDKVYFKLDSELYETSIYNERLEVPNTMISIGFRNIIVIVIILIMLFVIIYFYENKKIVIVSTLVILFSLVYFGIYFYRYIYDNKKNNIAVEKVINNEVEIDNENRYSYTSVIEIPSINLKRGIVSSSNKYNDVKYNIELIKRNDNEIIVASHNGNAYNSYFKDLHKISLGDEILFYDDGNIYKYIFTDKYTIKKDGYADIYNDQTKKSLILITCSEEDDNAQDVYIGYLKEM